MPSEIGDAETLRRKRIKRVGEEKKSCSHHPSFSRSATIITAECVLVLPASKNTALRFTCDGNVMKNHLIESMLRSGCHLLPANTADPDTEEKLETLHSLTELCSLSSS
ncbi:hypothetical protein NQZ68_031038 [Dissostichus eleginoides]|nr:hypothetical protein NQZ68_031038 [Dissostichus eleginoides]